VSVGGLTSDGGGFFRKEGKGYTYQKLNENRKRKSEGKNKREGPRNRRSGLQNLRPKVRKGPLPFESSVFLRKLKDKAKNMRFPRGSALI